MIEFDDSELFIGTAGWSIPSYLKSCFIWQDSHLRTYASRFNCVEINSSFYKNHKPDTYKKWADMVPANFCFSVKLSKEITHNKYLHIDFSLLQSSLIGISSLKNKWGILLVQLPPSLHFEYETVETFLSMLRELYLGQIAFEPRHKTWVSEKVTELFLHYDVSLVNADPDPLALSRHTTKNKLQYYRLHGSPEIYKSKYTDIYLQQVAAKIKNKKQTWCIFDNTTYGYATENAMYLNTLLSV